MSDDDGRSDAGGSGDALRRLVESGAGAAGVSAGTALGFIVDGVPGAMIGGTSGALLQDQFKHVAGDLAARVIGDSERERVGECLVRAHELIMERLSNGQEFRDPSFFRRSERRERAKRRSHAEQLLEGTFLAARDAYEAQKVELLARFYAHAVFSSLDVAMLNHVLSLAQRLTYRQLIIVGLYGWRQAQRERDESVFPLRETRLQDPPPFEDPTGLIFELYELVTLSLLAPTDNTIVLTWSQMNPSELSVHATGAHLYNCLRPDAADPRGMDDVISTLMR